MTHPIDLENMQGLAEKARSAVVEALTALGSESNPEAADACCRALANITALEGELDDAHAESTDKSEVAS